MSGLWTYWMDRWTSSGNLCWVCLNCEWMGLFNLQWKVYFLCLIYKSYARLAAYLCFMDRSFLFFPFTQRVFLVFFKCYCGWFLRKTSQVLFRVRLWLINHTWFMSCAQTHMSAEDTRDMAEQMSVSETQYVGDRDVSGQSRVKTKKLTILRTVEKLRQTTLNICIYKKKTYFEITQIKPVSCLCFLWRPLNRFQGNDLSAVSRIPQNSSPLNTYPIHCWQPGSPAITWLL